MSIDEQSCSTSVATHTFGVVLFNNRFVIGCDRFNVCISCVLALTDACANFESFSCAALAIIIPSRSNSYGSATQHSFCVCVLALLLNFPISQAHVIFSLVIVVCVCVVPPRVHRHHRGSRCPREDVVVSDVCAPTSTRTTGTRTRATPTRARAAAARGGRGGRCSCSRGGGRAGCPGGANPTRGEQTFLQVSMRKEVLFVSV